MAPIILDVYKFNSIAYYTICIHGIDTLPRAMKNNNKIISITHGFKISFQIIFNDLVCEQKMYAYVSLFHSESLNLSRPTQLDVHCYLYMNTRVLKSKKKKS